MSLVEVELPACLPGARLRAPFRGWSPPELPANPTLALCQTSAEAAAALVASPPPDGLVAATPEAACELKLRRARYISLEDFFDVQAFSEADEPMLAAQARWSDRVDEIAWEELPELRQLGLRPAGHYFLPLKVLIDSLYRAGFSLAHVLLAAEGGRLLLSDCQLREPSDDLFFDRPLYAAAAPLLAPEYGVTCEQLRPRLNAGSRSRQELWDRFRPLARDRLLRPARRVLGRAPRRTARDAGRPLLLCQQSYDIPLVAGALRRRGWSTLDQSDLLPALPWRSRIPRPVRRRLEQTWERFRGEGFFGEPFRWAGADLAPLAESRLLHWWFSCVPAMWNTVLRVRSRLELRRPTAMLLAYPWTPEEQGVLQAARSCAVPTITYQHGGFEGNCEYITHDMTELRFSDYRFVYGTGSEDYFSERVSRYVEPRAEPRAVGSCRLDRLRTAPNRREEVRRRLGIDDAGRLVLYLPTGYQRTWYLARAAYLAVPYFGLLCQVMATLTGFPDLRFVYKPFPERQADPLLSVIERIAPNVIAESHLRVPALVQASDACIVDIPSTGLLEALVTAKPLLVFSDRRFVNLRSEAAGLLRKRARLAETPEDFLAQLKDFLRGDLRELAAPDQRFLAAYGTHLNDGQSAERAASAVEEIAGVSGADHGRVQGRPDE